MLESLFSSWVNQHSFCFGHNLKPNGKTLECIWGKGTSSEDDSKRESSDFFNLCKSWSIIKNDSQSIELWLETQQNKDGSQTSKTIEQEMIKVIKGMIYLEIICSWKFIINKANINSVMF